MKTALELHLAHQEFLVELQEMDLKLSDLAAKMAEAYTTITEPEKEGLDGYWERMLSLDRLVHNIQDRIRYCEKHVSRLLAGDFDADILFLFRPEEDYRGELQELTQKIALLVSEWNNTRLAILN
jgi:hypothetical protein